MPKLDRLPWGGLASLLILLAAGEGAALDIQGRVVDRASVDAQGKARGIAGAQVTAYLGRRALASAAADAKGHYRLKNLPGGRIKVVYKAAGWQPAALIRHYALSPSDTGAFDAALDRAPGPKAEALEHYRGLARGWEAQALHPAFHREAWDSVFTLGGAYVEGDSSADYRGVHLHLAWEEFLAQERPLAERYHMAHALKARLDSLGWEAAPGMEEYLACDPLAFEALQADIRAALKDPGKIPSPKSLRKAEVPAGLVPALAARELARAGLPKRKRAKFAARWKQVWGRELPEAEEKAEPAPFKADPAVAALAERKPGSPVAQFLRGRARYAAKDYAGAVEALAQANKLRPGVFAAARYLEAMALLKLGRDAEALGRFHALRESPSPAWKARAYHGLGMINAKEGRNSEAASDLWRAVRIYPDAEAIFLLAEVSSKLNDNAQAETLLEERITKNPGEHRARYWLGRFAEAREQVGVAEDHFQKAYKASPQPEYAEAMARLLATREEWAAALEILEPLRQKLTREGRERYAECLLHAGRARDAVKEYAAAYAARPDGALLGRYAEALLQDGRAEEARKLAASSKDPDHPAARMVLAKASLRLGEVQTSRLLLQALSERQANDPDIHFLLGLGHYQERAWGKARKEFDQALRYRADHLEAVYYSGLALVKGGKPEDARNFFNELAQRTAPEWRAKGFLGVGLSFAAQQKPEAAENYYGRSLAALPNAEAAAHLALSRRRLGGPEHWESDARTAFELDSRNPKAVLAHGEALLARGKKAQALAHFRKAQEHSPSACDVLAGLAKSQYHMGQYQQSRSTSASAISQCPGEAEPLFYAASASDKLRNRKEAEQHFKAYRKAGGDEDKLPADYR